MQKVYFISGLGADSRAFSLLDLSFCEAVFVDWIKPVPNESLEGYALRLRKLIPDDHPSIIGVSFGGMLATEMAKADDRVNAIIIASNKSADEFPFYLRIGKYLPLYKWLPTVLIRISYRFKWLFGVNDKKHTQLLAAILADVNPAFLKWAIGAILSWKGKTIPPNVKHIHGTADKLLPFRYVKADFMIEGGTHLMSINNPREISSLLKRLIQH
ncbi:alpha/beta hydrolase [Terrimonas alba]|uniref:alpha/beta hydrolase n=1 Tax=Terrimonas alba TaxID=3349636 RepID=UPI0035F334B2